MIQQTLLQILGTKNHVSATEQKELSIFDRKFIQTFLSDLQNYPSLNQNWPCVTFVLAIKQIRIGVLDLTNCKLRNEGNEYMTRYNIYRDIYIPNPISCMENIKYGMFRLIFVL